MKMATDSADLWIVLMQRPDQAVAEIVWIKGCTAFPLCGGMKQGKVSRYSLLLYFHCSSLCPVSWCNGGISAQHAHSAGADSAQ